MCRFHQENEGDELASGSRCAPALAAASLLSMCAFWGCKGFGGSPATSDRTGLLQIAVCQIMAEAGSCTGGAEATALQAARIRVGSRAWRTSRIAELDGKSGQRGNRTWLSPGFRSAGTFRLKPWNSLQPVPGGLHTCSKKTSGWSGFCPPSTNPTWPASEPLYKVVRTKAKLKAATTEHMQALEKSPERVKMYLQDPRVKHAA